MISLYQDNDNPTPIRRKRVSSFELGGEEGNKIVAPKQEEEPSVVEKIQNGLKQLPFYIDPIISYSKQMDENARMRSQIRNINQQKPIWDYNEQYGDNQPIIKAANGAQVRTGSDESAQFRIDNGELIMLPDGKLEKAQGSAKKTDDIATILPQGTKIFSNTLKPVNSKHTFAKLASKHDYSEELKKLENPYTSLVSRTTAERMLQRKQKSLDSLFKEQQALNGDSSGEMSNAHGGVIMNEDGQFAYGGELKTGRQPIPIYDPYFQDPYYEASNDATVMKSFPRPLVEGFEHGGITSLPAGQETAYRAWIDKQGYKGSKGWAMDDDTYSGHDYDMRGYWKEAQMSPNRDKMLSMEEGQHFPDTYKLPSHESHSDESKYRKPPFNAKGFWEGENFIEYATGGTIPPIKWPIPTSSDSLSLYNNSIAVDKFYKDKGYQVINEKERIKTTPWKDMALAEEDMREGANPFNIYKHDDYYKPINDYQFNQRELQTGYLNLESPMPLYDRRINPQLKKTYEKKPSREWSESFNKIYSKAQNEVDKKYKMGDYRVDGVKHSKEDIHLSALETQNLVDKYSKEAGLDKGLGDNATVFLYDPIDIKPDSMLTPEERKIREKRKAESITTITPDITPPIIPSSESKVFTKVPTPLNPNAPQQRTTGIPFLAPETKSSTTPTPKPVAKTTTSSSSDKPMANIVRNAQTGWDTPMVRIKFPDGTQQLVSPVDYDKWAKQNPNHEKHFEMGGEVMYEDDNFRAFKDGGIHINPKNKGKFTSWAKSHGMGVQEAASHVMANKGNYSPATVKRANFAKNAAKWHHEDGGYVYYDQEFMKGGTVYSRNGAYTEGSEHDIDEEEINRLRSLGYKIKIIK